jgi:single-stranded DNA-binding protein
VLETITKGREVGITGRLSLSTFDKEIDGVMVEVTKPVIKLTAFHLCGKKPESSDAESGSANRKGFKLNKRKATA